MITKPLKEETEYRGVEQLVARRAHNPEVVGSNPSPATTTKSADFSRKSALFVTFWPHSKVPCSATQMRCTLNIDKIKGTSAFLSLADTPGITGRQLPPMRANFLAKSIIRNNNQAKSTDSHRISAFCLLF